MYISPAIYSVSHLPLVHYFRTRIQYHLQTAPPARYSDVKELLETAGSTRA